MIKVKEVALDILNGDLEVIDLIDDQEFLRTVDNSIVELTKNNSRWPDTKVAKIRKQIFTKIERVIEGGD